MALKQQSSGTQSIERVANNSFDSEFQTSVVQPLGFDGQNLQRQNADNLQVYTTTGGSYTYFCFAAPGTALDTPKWRIFRVDDSGNLLYADANANYDNVATDPTLLTYSYS